MSPKSQHVHALSTRTAHPGEQPGNPNAGQEGTPRPNPCAPPEADDKDCDCTSPPGHSADEPRHPRNPRRPADDCCERLIGLLQQVPGLQIPKPHKPKQKPVKRAQQLCETFGIADAIVPLVETLWRRFDAGEPGRNSYEDAVVAEFEKFSPRERDALNYGFDAYRKARSVGKMECLFNDCLAKAAETGAVEREWVAEEALREGLAFVTKQFFRGSAGPLTPGQVRPWDNIVAAPDAKPQTFIGPWPWLTALCPDPSGYEEYGNKASYRPAPPTTAHVFAENYQYDQACDYRLDISGKIVATCRRSSPPPPPPGGLFSTCEGGNDYTLGSECLRIPSLRAGGSIKLRGFNFITPTVVVRLVKQDDPTVVVDRESVVFGDAKTPVKGPDGRVIVDERVEDWVDFAIPREHPTMKGSPFPAGVYELTVLVNNVTGVGFMGSVHPRLETNRLLVKIEPDANVKYTLWSQFGRCQQETWGWGEDEIWWDAYVGHLVPKTVAPDSAVEIKPDHKEFDRGPWADMDSGEVANYNQPLFGPGTFELGGVIAIGVVGFEVDDESVAKDQLQDFGKAFWRALGSVVGIGAGSGAVDAAAQVLKVISVTVGIIVAAIVVVVIIAVCWLWATWAPADLIAFDLFLFDAIKAWEATDPKKPITPDTKYEFQKGVVPWTGEPAMMTVFHTPLPKAMKTSMSASATWIEEHFYETPAADEASSYMLEFRLARA